MQIKLITVHVTDQAQALRFYTEVLGFTRKADVTRGPFRWLTVTSPDDASGVELQLAAADDPAARAYQEARFAQDQPAVMFFTDDIVGECARIQARGGELRAPPTDVPGSTIAQIADGCGNLLQITQLRGR